MSHNVEKCTSDIETHTPGPWHVFEHPHGVAIDAVRGYPHMDESELTPVRIVSEGVNRNANVCLISKAPELLEIAEDLQARLIYGDFTDVDGSKLAEVIHRARGISS